ncbi:MAG: helix-turn-helix domain-containing protein [Phascolarctobacterium sp.]|nr:helix-turn-helix domain-containing protein [Phascolarctobacterium sp.]
MQKPYYRVREVAELTGLGKRTIYRHCQKGKIPCRLFEKHVLIPAWWVNKQNSQLGKDN